MYTFFLYKRGIQLTKVNGERNNSYNPIKGGHYENYIYN
jgi:hypothetical protein